jgi:uncharacterized protein YqjF (DUF2071 family)
MRWSDVLFAHHRVLASTLEPLVPRGLELDLLGGGHVAYVSVVGLHVVGPAPRAALDSRIVSRALGYTQLDVRTYVRGPSGPGLFLLHTLVDAIWPIGARLAGLPYRRDRSLTLHVEAHGVVLRARGFALAALPAVDVAPAPVADGTLERFLLERYVVYARLPAGRTYGVHVSHPPWRVRPCEVEAPPRLEAFGLADAELASAQLGEPVDVDIADVSAEIREPRDD